MRVLGQPGPWWLVALAVVLGAGLGRWLAAQLASGGYRLDDEWNRPLPKRPWRIAVLVPLVWGLLAWRMGGPTFLMALPALLLIGFSGVALAWIDADVHRLPHGLTYPTAVGVLGILVIVSAATGEWWPFARALLSGAAAYLVLLVLALLSRGQFGLGDVTLGGILALVLGFVDLRLPWWGLLFAFVVSGVVSALGLLTRRLTLRTALAFGPYLLMGGLLAVLLG